MGVSTVIHPKLRNLRMKISLFTGSATRSAKPQDMLHVKETVFTHGKKARGA